MLLRRLVFCGLIVAAMTNLGSAQSPSSNGVKALNPAGAIGTGNDTWSVGARAGDFIFVAGMQGIDPVTKKLVDGDEARIRQAFLKISNLLPNRREQRCRIAFASRSTYPTCTASRLS